jgi:integrase
VASLVVRGNNIWISYYINGELIRKSLQLPDTKVGWDKAKDIKLNVESDLRRNNFTAYLNVKNIKLLEAIKLLYKDRYNDKEVFFCAFLHLVKIVGDRYVEKITAKDIEKVKEYLLKNKAHETAVSYTNHIKILFDYLIKNKYYTNDNPAVKIKSIAQPVVSITNEHFKLILHYLNEHNKNAFNFITFLKLTGCRLSEGLNIRWENIDFTKGLIYINNTKEHRIDIFPMYNELQTFLLSLHNTNQIGKCFSYTNRQCRFWNRCIKALKLEQYGYTLHTIRKTFATNYANKLMPIELMQLLRHRDIKTTMKYYVNLEVIKLGDKLNVHIL